MFGRTKAPAAPTRPNPAVELFPAMPAPPVPERGPSLAPAPPPPEGRIEPAELAKLLGVPIRQALALAGRRGLKAEKLCVLEAEARDLAARLAAEATQPVSEDDWRTIDDVFASWPAGSRRVMLQEWEALRVRTRGRLNAWNRREVTHLCGFDLHRLCNWPADGPRRQRHERMMAEAEKATRSNP